MLISLFLCTAPFSPDQLAQMSKRFAPVEISADVSALPDNERAALAKLVQAGRVMDAIFLRQVWAGNEPLLLDLLTRGDAAKPELQYFLINKGPWSRLDHEQAFISGVPEKPQGGSFYPADATKSELETFFKSLGDADRAKATGFYSVIRRDEKGTLVPVPYSQAYQSELGEAARLLNEAAALTSQPTLKDFLSKRAHAFLSNDYYDSDVAWMNLDASIEPTIGPYEVYEDGWFNYKAAFESFIAVRDQVESQKLARFSAQLQTLEDHLPIDNALKNKKLGALAPIRVVNVVFNSGDANKGVQTAAYNLPNDERVVREKGSKRVMLKNVQEAKFKTVLTPISKVTTKGEVAFDVFFTHILLHELMHGLGPHSITVSGRQTTVRQELKEAYSAIEEAKADVSGLWAMQYLIDHGVLDKQMEKTMYTTYVASALRSIRFGSNEAHGKGMALQLSSMLDHGAIKAQADGTFSVDNKAFKKTMADLTHDLMTLQAHGDYAAARKLLDEKAVVRPEIQKAIDRLKDAPVDIAPLFQPQ